LIAWSEMRGRQLDMLAGAVRSALDLDSIFAMAGLARGAAQTGGAR
jgi:hypothetical protein